MLDMPVYVCSDLEQAESLLVLATQPHYNVTCAEAVRLRIQRRELGRAQRIHAEELLLNWEGTSAQIATAHRIHATKAWVIANSH